MRRPILASLAPRCDTVSTIRVCPIRRRPGASPGRQTECHAPMPAEDVTFVVFARLFGPRPRDQAWERERDPAWRPLTTEEMIAAYRILAEVAARLDTESGGPGQVSKGIDSLFVLVPTQVK